MNRSLGPIFLVVFVDVLGFTLVMPLLPFYAERFGASPFVVGLVLSIYAACALIATPLVGRLSDRHGRRTLLLYTQLGTFTGLLVLGCARSLWMVFAGRIIDGLSAGNLAIAQAYISDRTGPDERASAFGVIGIATALSFIVGPGLAIVLGRHDATWPFLAAALLSAASMVLTAVLLPRDQTRAAAPTRGAFSLATYASYVRRPALAGLYAQFFLHAFAFAWFLGGFAMFAERRFTVGGHPWGPREIVLLIAYSGVLSIFVQGAAIGRMVRRFGEPGVVLLGFAGAATAYGAVALAAGAVLVIAGATISAFGNGVLRPVLASRITQRVGSDEQGLALGLADSLDQIATVLAPLLGGLLVAGDCLTTWALVPAIIALLGLLAARARRDGR